MLTVSQLAARDGKITASFLPSLMANDEERIISKWKELIGAPDWCAEDFSTNWMVQCGSFLEPFVLDWHEKKTTPLTRRGEVVAHPERPFFCATLDAFRASNSTVIDCKVIGGYRKIDDVLCYYLPQMIGQRGCVECNQASLLIVHGGTEPQEYNLEIDAAYEKAVWQRIDEFWNCVSTLTPPVALAPVAAPVIPIKTYSFDGNNAWAAGAADWLANKAARDVANQAEKSLKAMVPADAIRCHGHGAQIRRDRAGRLTLKEGE